MDAIGCIVVAGYIFSIAYVSLKEFTLVLMDACQCKTGFLDEIKNIIEENYSLKLKCVELDLIWSNLHNH